MQADDAWGAVAELAASQHGAFHRRQAADLNLSNARLRSAVARAELRQPSKNVFVFTAATRNWHQRLASLTLSGAVASHASAAALHGFDGFSAGPIELTYDRGRFIDRPAEVSPLTIHRWKSLDRPFVTKVQNIPCTNIATTLCQLGMTVGESRVEQALDSALRNDVSPLWIANTARELHRPGPSGVGVLQRLLDEPRRSGVLPDSWFERLLSLILASSILPAPVLQHPVETASGNRKLDLAWPDVWLGLEGHSRRFHSGPTAEESDHQRDLDLSAEGWEVVYITWSMAADPAALVEVLTKIYLTRLTQLGPRMGTGMD